MSKHLLLTGGAGFIGHHTVEHILRKTDWTITIVDRLTYAGSQNHLTDMEIWKTEGKRVHFVFHDFRAQFQDINLAMVTQPEPDYIVHMGAETHVDNSIRDPRIFVETNVIGTLNMLELARAIQPKIFLYVSTDEVYGPAPMEVVKLPSGRLLVEPHLHKEGEPFRPSNPYSASKAGAEALVYAFWNTYGLNTIVTNTMNNFGERQNPEKFIPRTVRSILKGEPVTVHVKKDELGLITDVSSRCWLHARNHADGILYLLNVFGEASGTATKKWQQYNIVGQLAGVDVMADKIGQMLGLGSYVEKDYVDFHSFRPGHDMHYGLDGSLLKSLGWVPPMTLDHSLEQTVRWMRDHPTWLQM
jgi:dTDP-glucose 4,6-dehydratase